MIRFFFRPACARRGCRTRRRLWSSARDDEDLAIGLGPLVGHADAEARHLRVHDLLAVALPAPPWPSIKVRVSCDDLSLAPSEPLRDCNYAQCEEAPRQRKEMDSRHCNGSQRREMDHRAQARALVRPPSSLSNPALRDRRYEVPIYAAFIAISRRFRVPASNFGLWAHFRRLSPSCKIPFPARLGQAGGAAESGEVTLSRTGNSGGIGFQSQRLELAATPIGVQVSQAFDV